MYHTWEEKRYRDQGTTESLKQDEPKESHTKMYPN